MELKTEGIVLKKFKKGEHDNITVIFTRSAGKVMVSSKSTRKLKSKLNPTLELFSMNDYLLVKKKKDSQYYCLAGSRSLKMFENMRVSLRKIGFSYLVVELLNKFLQLEDGNAGLYELTKNVMHAVDSGEYRNIENVESFFKLKLLEMSGFDISADTAYLRDRRTAKEYLELMSKVMNSTDPASLEIDYARVRELNKLVDSYVIHVLGEDVISSRFLEGLKLE